MPLHRNLDKLKEKQDVSFKDKIKELEEKIKKSNEYITLEFKLETSCGCGYYSIPYKADFPADADLSHYTNSKGILYLDKDDLEHLGAKNLRER